jgi:guanine nucleotide-binding protein G(I)/G(S)/G(T) subunit beta-1
MSHAVRDLETCQKMCEELKTQIDQIRSSTGKKILAELAQDVEVTDYEPKQRNLCTGHFGKIYALHWGPDSNHIVTASQDGKLIIWASHSGNKQLAITLNSAWVMTCAFSPTYEYIASGGLDNTVSIFKTSNQNAQAGEGRFRSKDLYRELEKHDGYLSCARFIDDQEIISASGDGTCILWDVENRSTKSVFMDHTGDVMSIDLNSKKNPNYFVSGSVDATAKIWDMRSGDRCIANFPGHISDINTVKWFVDGESVVTGSDDGTVRLFDMRSYRQLNEYSDGENRSLHSQDAAGVTSVDVSASGQYIFAAYDNGQVYMWSALRAIKICDMPHDSRVSSLGVSPDGYALATGCWDFNLRVFA